MTTPLDKTKRSILVRDKHLVLAGYAASHGRSTETLSIICDRVGFTVVDITIGQAISAFTYDPAMEYRDRARLSGRCA